MLRSAFVVGSVVLVAAACGSSARTSDGASPANADGGVSSGGFIADGGTTTSGPCSGLECQKKQCGNGTTTSISGTVVAPTPSTFGTPDPIYNAIVYVPNGKVEAFTPGVSCDKCGTPVSGQPVSITLTDEHGNFSLTDVPVGTNIPLVVQIGRWRRQVVIPKVTECTDNPQPREQTRLPRSSKEGDIPLMAIATSVYDPTECILRKIGIDDSEFSAGSGQGRVHLYQGQGATIAGASDLNALFHSQGTLAKYDLVAVPCTTEPPDSTANANLVNYAATGGRVYITDLSYPVISSSPPWSGTANFDASGTPEGSLTATIDTSFAKGQAMAEWLFAIGATPTKGTIDIEDSYDRFSSVGASGQRWIYAASGPQTYSFNTPVGVAEDAECGRVAYSSFHIAASDGSSLGGGLFGAATYPQECSPGPLTAQEKALEFMLFDLSSCVQKDDKPPVAPPK